VLRRLEQLERKVQQLEQRLASMLKEGGDSDWVGDLVQTGLQLLPEIMALF
jgi:hypothetical protein